MIFYPRCCCTLWLFILLLIPLNARAEHYSQPALILQPDNPHNFSADFANIVTAAMQRRWEALNPDANKPLFYLSELPPDRSDFTEVLFIRFTGACDILPQIAPPHRPRPLGYVSFVDGQPTNYIVIDCAEIVQTINGSLRPASAQERMSMMARAISRVFEHEYLHIHLHTAHHDNEGVFAAALSERFLVAPEITPPRPSRSLVEITGTGL